jgi:shikimate dehydrogenase
VVAKPKLIRLALFGTPVGQSLSPRIHTLFAEQAGLHIEYRAIECAEAQLEEQLRNLADRGARGCNITVPLKHQAYHLCGRHSERARRAAAVNTLLLEDDSSWYGDNTDGSGLVRDLRDNLGIELTGRRIAIIGAGGAAAGILHDLLLQKPQRLILANRDAERARRLAARFSDLEMLEPSPVDALRPLGPFDLVINATSAGHSGGLPAITAGLFSAGAACYDLNYGGAHEGLGTWCARRGIPCFGGLGMLVEQAAEGFGLWTGFEPRTRPVIDLLSSGHQPT